MPDYSISCYCFNRLLTDRDISLKAMLKVCRSVGFSSIEMLDLYWDKERERRTQAESLALQAAAEGMGISCYTVHNDLGVFDDGEWRALVDRILDDVALAECLGAPAMRVEATIGPREGEGEHKFEEYLERVAKGLKEVTRRAAESGISVALENHGRYMGTWQRVKAVIDAVAEDNFGACLDMANFMVVDQDPVEAVTQLAGNAFHVHVKDMHFFPENPGPPAFKTNAGNYLIGAVFGEGAVDVARCLDIIVKAGYRGAFSLEFEGRENVFWAVRRALVNVKENLARLPLR
ncbi:MAG: sugar phosphate isomerase/epimerase family protein [Planctomycetota bacterium]